MTAEHAEIEELVAAYVLDATDPEETELVRAHLDDCATCRELALRLGVASRSLPLSIEQKEAPEGLRERVLAAAAGVPQAAANAPVKVVRRPLPATRTSHMRAGWRLPAVAAAAIVAFALGGGVGLGVGRTGFGSPQPAAVAQHSLTGTGSMAGAGARVFDLEQEHLTLVQFSGLPALGQGRVYELWLIDSAGHPRAGAVFAPDPDGTKVILLAQNLSSVSTLAVTDEQGPSGVSAPTKQPELAGPV
jgi:anti-sigma-K factor RskA